MSTERDVEHTIVVDTANTKSDDFKNLDRAGRKARLATVLERGMTADRLSVKLPDDLYGEWVANDPMEIARLQSMGFELDTEYAPKRALHGSGSSEARVGDVVFMITGKETKELMDEIRRDKYEEAHGRPKKQKEETEFKSGMAEDAAGVKTITESAASSANYDQLKQALTNTE
jgi:hypothetical protein